MINMEPTRVIAIIGVSPLLLVGKTSSADSLTTPATSRMVLISRSGTAPPRITLLFRGINNLETEKPARRYQLLNDWEYHGHDGGNIEERRDDDNGQHEANLCLPQIAMFAEENAKERNYHGSELNA